MPVFHTKTIESILEPVAQQVSRLVILHEEAEDGNAMPDLSRPVEAVKLAVDNLVQVGYETVNTSNDGLLKQDMPVALVRVEEAASSLLEASVMLKQDPFSAPARKKLIYGSRGILQGTSALLLAFDESEVRKIIAQCRGVLDYIAVSEVIESMPDLVTFVRNISPGLTRMTKQVDDREKELTHLTHKAMLTRGLEQIKVLTPVFISSIKVYVNMLEAESPSASDSRDNRNYTCQCIYAEIEEIIRVLQLTSADEEDLDTDDAALMRRALNDMEHRRQQAHDWLSDPQAPPGGIGELAVQNILESALRAAERCANPEDREAILKAVSNIRAMTAALNEVKAKGNEAEAQALGKSIERDLANLQALVSQAIQNTEQAGARAVDRTLEGRMEQAMQWLRNPAAFDLASGEGATRAVISDARSLADSLPPGRARDEVLQLSAEAEAYVNQLADLCRKGMGNSPQAKAIAKALADKMNELHEAMSDVAAKKVVDDFLDVEGPLKQLTMAALAPAGNPNREGVYHDKAATFEAHSARLAETGEMVIKNSSVQSKPTIEMMHTAAKQLTTLGPQVVRAGRVVLMNPGHEASVEQFNLMKQQWTDNVNKIKDIIDNCVDTQAFMKASEAAILEDSAQIEHAIVNSHAPAIIENAASIARRSNRVLQVAQQEVDNSEDPLLQLEVTNASNNLKGVVPTMVGSAKALVQDPANRQFSDNWRRENDKLIDSVRDIRHAVAPKQTLPPPLSPYPAPPPGAAGGAYGAAGGINAAGGRNADGSFNSSGYMNSAGHINPADGSYNAGDMSNHMNSLSLEYVNAHPEVYARVCKYDLHSPKLTPPPSGGVAVFTYSHDNTDDSAPPRPPLPQDQNGGDPAPPRPPLPSVDPDAEMERVFQHQPEQSQPIMLAAHNLHQEVKHWESADNELISAAKQMALLMAKLSQLVRGEGGSKKDLIDTARAIAQQSAVVTKLANRLAAECTDKRMRTNLLQVCERIPTIGTQLKILSTVKATMLGSQGSQEDVEATEMLVGNAQNLMQSVRDTVRASEGASIKIRVQSGYSIRWVRRRPWYT